MSHQLQASIVDIDTAIADSEPACEFPDIGDFGFRDESDHLSESIDKRLQVPNVIGVAIRIDLADGTTLNAEVFALTPFDVVVCLDGAIAAPAAQGVRFVLTGKGFTSDATAGVLHWHGKAGAQTLLGIFSADPIPRQLSKTTTTDVRPREIRYPINQRTVVRGDRYRQEGHVVDYSLNGIAVEVARPLELDQRYEATLMIAGQMLKLPMLCCFNTRSKAGYIAGCGLRCLEGSLLACARLKETNSSVRPSFHSNSRRFPALNHMSGRGVVRSSQSSSDPGSYDRCVDWFNTVAETVDERLTDRPVLSRAAILILAAMLLAMSFQVVGKFQAVTFLYGLFGIVAYIGLTHAASLREKFNEDATVRTKRALAERRLSAAEVPPPEAD